jgi:flagellar biosynthesis protein FliR
VTAWLATLTQITGLAEGALWGMALVFLRMGAMMALIPGFGDPVVPMRVRLALTVALTALVYPMVATSLVPPGGAILAPVATEILAGLIFGLALRLMIMALQLAGTLAAQATTLSQMAAGAAPEPQPAIGHALVWGGLALAMALDLHVQLVAYILVTYDLIPSGAPPRADKAAAYGLSTIVAAFRLGVTLAAPFVIASLIYNLAMGVINRAMPQLMVSFVGAPALTLGGLALLAVAAMPVLAVWQAALQRILTNPAMPLG